MEDGPPDLGSGAELQPSRERGYAPEVVVLGLLIAAVLSPMRYGVRGFLMNLGYYWGPQVLVLGLLLPFKPGHGVVAGAALALAGYLVAFWVWAHSLSHSNGLEWLFYFMSFPGALVGAVAAVFLTRRPRRRSGVGAALGAAALTAAGIGLNTWIAFAVARWR